LALNGWGLLRSLSRRFALPLWAVEAPPLLLHPETDAGRAAVAAVGLAPPGPEVSPFLPSSARMPAAVGGAVVGVPGGYLIALPLFGAALASAVVYAVDSSTLRAGEATTMVRESPPWMPTMGLAMLAARALQGSGTREVFVVEGYAQLPIEDRSVNVSLENWLAPVRRWYNADVSTLDNTQLGTAPADAILEVGVSNYEYFHKRMRLGVMVKMSDSTTKQVLGRCHNPVPNYGVKAEPLAVMLQDEGQRLRRLIETLGETSLTQCLKDLGLIPR